MIGISMAINFKGTENQAPETVYLRDRELIKKTPVLVRSIESQHPDWETTQIDMTEPMEIPFPKSAGDFFFKNLWKYQTPDFERETPQLEDYTDAKELSLPELKEVLELANFLECTSFMHCIGFVIAKKLEEKSIEEVADYFGVECTPAGNFLDEADGWIHPPAEIFENQDNNEGAAPGNNQ